MLFIRRKPLVVGIFAVSLFALLWLALSSTEGSLISFIRAQVAPPNPLTDGVSVHLIPSRPTILPSEPLDIDVYVIPNGHQVTAAELRLTFDPAILIPRSPHPIATGSALSLVLPNNEAGPGTPYPATSSATWNQALIYLGVNCTETGCPFPDTSTRFKLATLQLQATATASGTTRVVPRPFTPTGIPTQSDGVTTLTAALTFDYDATKVTTGTSLSITTCPLPYDFSPNMVVDVTDLMQAAALWNTGPGNAGYNGQFDLDHDGDVDIVDIQTVAATWNQSCNN